MKAVRFFIAILLPVVLVSCGNEKQKQEAPTTARIEKEISLKYATCFSIHDFGDYKILTVLPLKGSKQSYVLYPKEKNKPQVSDPKAVFIPVPVGNTACMSSLYVGYLDRLQLTDRVVAVDNGDYVSNKKVAEKIKAGTVKELAKAGGLNEEITIALHPDLVMTYGSGVSADEANKKVKDAGIPFVYCIDNRETSPLGRAEWIKFVACFYKEEKKADSLFNETEKKYLDLKASAEKAPESPTVFTETKLSDAWYVPGGKSFMATLIKDAHASYCWAADSNATSLPLSFEQVYKVTANADYWINLGFCSTKKDLLNLDKRYTGFKAFRDGNIFNYNARSTPAGGNEFWETGLIMPDLILLDMIKIFHPSMYTDKPFTYYQKLE
jgi:iron complex transport system substrate-binding protein